MTTTEPKTSSLEFRWTVSRARDTAGYNICTLYVDGSRVARCNGGGYDMKGTVLGDFIAKHYADRLRSLKPEDMPEQSHWKAADKPRAICINRDCQHCGEGVIDSAEHYAPCPHCGQDTRPDAHDGKRIDDGRYFYGLTFHDPNYDPSKAVIGVDCTDRTLSHDDHEGETVEQAEDAGVSFGLERYQAFYSASSKVPTERHTVPLIDGACGMSSVEKIAQAIGLSLEWLPGRKNRKDDLYLLHDERE